jgi:hypothetical protein
LRRTVTSGALLVVLLGAAAAFAAGEFNNYRATEIFCQSTPAFTSNSCAPVAAGSRRHPVPGAIHELWTANGSNGHQTAPLTHIVARMYGIKTDAKDFPTCTAKTINTAGNSGGWNQVCPKGSEIASGPVNSLFVPYNDATAQNPPHCNAWLSIYNGGVQNGTQVQVFFFSEYPDAPGPQYSCVSGAEPTGAAPAYNGYATNPSSANHNTWSINIPVPVYVCTAACQGWAISLVKLNVVYAKLTDEKNGHTVAYEESIGCKKGERPYSFTFYAQNYQGQSPAHQTTTVSHTTTCG